MKDDNFSQKIVEWYRTRHRNLPWRNTQNPYKIWLSEIILQQTRVAQGLPYYLKFIRHYPDIKSLAKAKERDVLRLWQGLGYYTRARNLHQCAREIVRKHDGKFPPDYAQLKELPGIGDYTAAAIASFAFQKRVAVVDGNVFRVLSRVYGIDRNTGTSEGKKYFLHKANKLIQAEEPGLHNQAVMEFGALQCLPNKPACGDCIFNRRCFAFNHNCLEILPVKIPPVKKRKRYLYYFVLTSGKKMLLARRDKKDIWKGLYDFPHYELEHHIKPAIVFEKYFSAIGGKKIKRDPEISNPYKHVLTHQVIYAHFIKLDVPAGRNLHSYPGALDGRWYSSRAIEKLPKPILITRYLEAGNIL